jgi:hypothetical protein
MGKKLRSGTVMNILEHISESLETLFGLKIFYADPEGRGSGIFLTLDPGWKKFGSVMKIPKHSPCYY